MDDRFYRLNRAERLVSLDALRGFDMFLIAGAENMVRLSAEYTNWAVLKHVEAELHHAEWDGFTFFDLIFPLFMFLAGVSFAFSLNKRLERGDSLTALHGHVVQRGLLLVLLGMISVFIYIAQQFIAFRDITHLLLHDEQMKLHPLFIELMMFAMKWLLLYYLYCKKIFFRV
ncbi:MAG: DUF5009 domain-containing protein [Planctomycetales bacterium]|nr:DUF5009 domain-containing protein [Planctomycetales bacterium]